MSNNQMTHQLISCAAIEQTGMIWDERTLTTLFIRVKDIDIFPRKKRRDNKLEEWQSFRSNPALGHGPWQNGKAQTRTLTEAKPCTRKTGFPLGFPSGLHLSLTSIRISHFYSLLGCLKTNGLKTHRNSRSNLGIRQFQIGELLQIAARRKGF